MAETAVPDQDVEIVDEEVPVERWDNPWRVLVFNDEIHTFEEVIVQLIKATGCTTEHAQQIAFEIHTRGKATAYEGSFEECFRVQGVLREIQLVTEIEG